MMSWSIKNIDNKNIERVQLNSNKFEIKLITILGDVERNTKTQKAQCGKNYSN